MAADSIDNSSPSIDTAEIVGPGLPACCLAPQAERLVVMAAAMADWQKVRRSMGTPFPLLVGNYLSLAALTEIGAVTGKILVFFGCIFTAKQHIAMREPPELLDDIAVQLGKLSHSFKRFPVGR